MINDFYVLQAEFLVKTARFNCFDDSGERKPSSKPFEMALNKLQLKPEDSLMIGDWPERDVVGAKQIGMRTAFAVYGDTFGTKNSGADWDIQDVSEIITIIKKINNIV